MTPGTRGRRRTGARVAACLLALAMAATAPGVAGCARGPGRPGPRAEPPPAPAEPEQVLRFNLGGEPATLDPARAEDAVSATVIHQLFEGLTRRAAGGLEPGMAERWEVSEDGLRYRFHLRDAFWSNGETVTAGDFEFAWKRVLDPSTRSPYASALFFLKGAQEYHRADPRQGAARLGLLRDGVGVRAVDDRTLEVELKAPAPFFLELVASFPYLPVPRGKVEADPQGWAEARRAVGNGPFRVDERARGRLALIRNELYWDRRAVPLRQVVFTTVADPGGALSLFEAGEIDAAMPRQVPLAEAPRLLASGQLRQAPLLATYYLLFNTSRPPFQDARVRRAFSLAVDRRELLARTMEGLPRPALALVPPGIPDPATGRDFRDEGGDYLRDGDVQAAQALLAQAGYPGGRGFPRVSVLYNVEGEQREIMQALQQMWRDRLGVEVQLVGQEWGEYLKSREAGDFHVARVGWIADYPDPAAFLSLFRGDDERNAARWRNAVYDGLLREAERAADPGARMEALHRAERFLMAEAPLAPVYFYVQMWLQRETVDGVFVDRQGNVFLRRARILPRPAPGGGGDRGGSTGG